MNFDYLESTRGKSIIVSDYELNIVHMGDKITELFEYPKEELLGKNIKILMTGKILAKHDKYVNNYLMGNEPKIIGTDGKKTFGVTKNGKIIDFILKLEEISINNIIYYVAIFL